MCYPILSKNIQNCPWLCFLLFFNSLVIWQIMREYNYPWDFRRNTAAAAICSKVPQDHGNGKDQSFSWFWSIKRSWFSEGLIIRMGGRDLQTVVKIMNSKLHAVTGFLESSIHEQCLSLWGLGEAHLVSLSIFSLDSPAHLFACWWYAGRKPFSIYILETVYQALLPSWLRQNLVVENIMLKSVTWAEYKRHNSSLVLFFVA